jgi:hypothetical protein
MEFLGPAILITGGFPIWQAWRANRDSSLSHAIGWGTVGWVAWCLAGVTLLRNPASAEQMVYIALCFTGGAGVAVLGARRPGVTAWNLVVVGLLAVNLLPLAEGLMHGGRPNLDLFRTICVAGTIIVGILNYLPTRLAPASVLLLAGVGLLFRSMIVVEPFAANEDVGFRIGMLLVDCVPWLAYASVRARPAADSEFNYRWLDFRDRYGFVWGQRLRDQFNRSAANAAWPVILRWQGLRVRRGSTPPGEPQQEQILATLKALMKRFTQGIDIANRPVT